MQVQSFRPGERKNIFNFVKSGGRGRGKEGEQSVCKPTKEPSSPNQIGEMWKEEMKRKEKVLRSNIWIQGKGKKKFKMFGEKFHIVE